MDLILKLHFYSRVKGISVFRVIQDETSIFLYMIVTYSVRKNKIHMGIYLILNGYSGGAV